MREAKGSSRTFIWVISSVVLLGIVIVLAYYVGFPLIKYGTINLCWGKFTSHVGELKAGTVYMGEYKDVDVDFGNCVLRLWFVNRDTLNEIKDITDAIEAEIERDYGRRVDIKSKIFSQCDEDNEENKGFIIASPWFGEAPDVGGMFTWVLIGAAVGGLVGPGAGPILGKLKIRGVPIIPVLKMFAGGATAAAARGKVKAFVEQLEEWGKTAVCIPLKREFAEQKFIPEKGIDESGKIESVKGSYCIILYKGKEKYYVHQFEKDKKCKDITEEINDKIKDFKELDGE